MSWDSYERAAKKGPGPIIWKIIGLVVLFSVVLGVISYALGWVGSAGQVAKDEFGPQAALEKYEWFINQSNAIDKMDQDVVLFEGRRADVEKNYAAYGTDRSAWPLDVRTSYNRESQQARDDLVAVVSQRNSLVRDYNAQSEKFNWALFQTRPDKPKEKYFEYTVK